MDINGIGDGIGTTLPNKFNEMSSEDFMKIMFAELSNQDPLEPQDSANLMNQISSLRDIESNMQLMDQLDELVTQNQLASAGSMIGKSIRGLDENNLPAEGVVSSVSLESNEVWLTLESGQRVSFAQIEMIYDGGNDEAA